VPDIAAAAGNLGQKALRRLLSLHKPLVRQARRRERAREQAAILEQALAAEPALARIAAGTGPVIAGPWLAEVGYEAMYWLPFLRWVQDRYALAPSRLIALSRGGVRDWYAGIADRYVDIFDHVSPADLAARNERRQAAAEGGGRKQTSVTPLDEELLAIARRASGAHDAAVLHPSLMFQLFRDVWLGNLPASFLWSRTDYVLTARPARPDVPGLPADYVAVKFYSGAALPDTPANRQALRGVVETLAARSTVVVLDTGLAVDDHADYLFGGLPNVVSARDWMTPQTNLGVQTAVIANASTYVGTCGGLAWLAPFLGVPTVAVYSDDRLLGPHLMLARQAVRQSGAAGFMPLDLRAVEAIGVAGR
jgi:hypothetical protein